MSKEGKPLEHNLNAQEFELAGELENLDEHGGINEDIAASSESKIVDYSSNLNPFGPPKNVIKAVKKSINSITRYPDNSYSELVKKIAEHNDVDEKQIIVGNGSAELFFLVANFFKPRRTLLFKPTFSEYIRAALSVNSRIDWLNLRINNDIKLDFKELTNEIGKYDLAILGNPNNPTGTMLSEAQLVTLLETAKKHGTFLLLDEAFIDFVEEKKDLSACKYVEKYDNVAVVRSLTKIFSIPGLRLGYLIASEKIIGEMKKLRPPWMVSNIAATAGIAALSEPVFVVKSRTKLIGFRNELANDILALGLKAFESRANFLLVNIAPSGLSSKQIKERIFKKGFLVRDCGSFGMGHDFIRIAVRKDNENRLLIKALKELLENAKND